MTISVSDVPTHHFVSDFVDTERRLAQAIEDVLVFGHDLLNAYWQWSLKELSRGATFRPLSFHLPRCLGAAATV